MLARGVFSLTRTKRRRVLWCAWWTGAPTAAPFRVPDAWGGGARDEDEARAAAEAAAGMPLEPIEGRWAGAWVRVRAGLPPFVTRAPRVASGAARPVDPYAVLGVDASASLTEVRAAFRRLARIHHPDQGGSADAFMAVQRAYETIVARRERRRRA